MVVPQKLQSWELASSFLVLNQEIRSSFGPNTMGPMSMRDIFVRISRENVRRREILAVAGDLSIYKCYTSWYTTAQVRAPPSAHPLAILSPSGVNLSSIYPPTTYGVICGRGKTAPRYYQTNTGQGPWIWGLMEEPEPGETLNIVEHKHPLPFPYASQTHTIC